MVFYHIKLNNTNLKTLIAMAKIKDIIDGAETKHPAKKKSKSTLTFTAGTDITAKSSVADSLTKFVESAGLATGKVESDAPVYKEAIALLDTKVADLPKDSATVVKEVTKVNLPVEEVKPKASNNKPAPYNNYKGSQQDNYKPYNRDGKKANGSELPPAAGLYPEHMVNIALLVKNNAEIRRFTSLGILNYLLQKKEIKGEKRYVGFKWNKFIVKFDNLSREYSYNEPFFLNCLIASFSSFASSAQKTMDIFTRKEMQLSVGEAADTKVIDDIVASVDNM